MRLFIGKNDENEGLPEHWNRTPDLEKGEGVVVIKQDLGENIIKLF
jgi:hypothetical protein